MPEDDYEIEIVEKVWPNGTTSKSTRILIPRELIDREVKRLLLSRAEYPNDMQEVIIEAARNLARDGSTRGHRESLDWLIGYADGILQTAADVLEILNKEEAEAKATGNLEALR